MSIGITEVITAIYLIEAYAIIGAFVFIMIYWLYIVLFIYFICIPIFYGFFYNKLYNSNPRDGSNGPQAFIGGLFWPILIILFLLNSVCKTLYKFGCKLHK